MSGECDKCNEHTLECICRGEESSEYRCDCILEDEEYLSELDFLFDAGYFEMINQKEIGKDNEK